MLFTSVEMDTESITVPYNPLFDEIRKNNGFVDVRGNPKLAKKIVEGSGSAALRRLLVLLAAKDSKLFSIGCDLGTSFAAAEKDPYCAGGYIQVMHSVYWKRTPDHYGHYADAISDFVETNADTFVWGLHHVIAPLQFNLDRYNSMTGSLRIWFRAWGQSEQQALSSRETLISRLGAALTAPENLAILAPPNSLPYR